MSQAPSSNTDIGRFDYIVVDSKNAFIIASWVKCFFWQIKNNRLMDTWIVNPHNEVVQANRNGLY